MATYKRDRTWRAYNHGFRVGMQGRSMERCPYESVLELRASWLNGWRAGRDQLLTGSINYQHG